MWKYKKKLIHCLEDIPKNHQDADHFIYRIVNKTNGKFYIGKKILYNKKKIKLSAKKKKELNTRRKYDYKHIESDWIKYYGSSLTLQEELNVLGPDKFEREILEFVTGKKKASYREAVWIIKTNAVLSEKSYNSNLLGRFFKKDME